MTQTFTTGELPDAIAALVERAAQPGFDAWRHQIIRLSGCTNPIHLVGNGALVDAQTGVVLHRYGSTDHGGRLLTACGNRRTSVCPACARTYRADAYHLLRAGLAGGKGIGAEVAAHPQVFATLTAPSFGPVHTRRENARPCRPRRAGERCPHGAALGCHVRHAEDDPRLGEPLCPRCYDYAGAVLWQAHAGQLWHRFALELRRELARRAGVSRTALAETVRLAYAKVAEYQRRGLIHFHAVIRLDGGDGPRTAPPGWATTALLIDTVRTAAGLVRLPAPGAEVVGPRVLRFGRQVDVRPIEAGSLGEPLSSEAVAGYIAKYATKGAEVAGAVDRRVHQGADLATLPVRNHTLRMIGTCWWLGGLEPFTALQLRRWAHMLGYRGHFTTKSRRYSTTFTALRSARAEHRAREQRAALGLADRPTVTVGQWRYAGRGYSPEEALIAASTREGGGGHDA